MGGATSRIAFVGNATYFENHFPEGWRKSASIRVFDANEGDASFLLSVANFRPEVTVFYRPELYRAEFVTNIPGFRVGWLSEPVPKFSGGKLIETHETHTRLAVYSSMAWPAYHLNIYYDVGKTATIRALGWPIGEFRQLPIDTSVFRPTSNSRPIDFCFVGKPTARRIRILDAFRYMRYNFVWVAHGVSGRQLAGLFRRSKVVVNIHADELPAFEPRVLLGAACGCAVFTEDLGHIPEDLAGHLVTITDAIYGHAADAALDLWQRSIGRWVEEGPLRRYSALESAHELLGRRLKSI